MMTQLHTVIIQNWLHSPHTSPRHVIYEEKNWMQRHKLYPKNGEMLSERSHI